MSKSKKNATPKYLKPTFCALLAALIVLLTFFVTIPLGPLTITLNCLPVAIGSVLLGPVYGIILGAVFGIASFLKTLTGGGGPLMTALLAANPFLTFVMCFVPRVICGWVPGLLFRALPIRLTLPNRLFKTRLTKPSRLLRTKLTKPSRLLRTRLTKPSRLQPTR